MPYESFHARFPEIAAKETRTITVMNHAGIPTGNYALIEMYCNEPACDCRRVFFDVYDWERGTSMAIIAYGWESEKFYARWFGDNDPRTIRDLFDLMQFDPRWTLPSLMDQNPMAWMNSVDGLMIDDRHAPRFIQEEAYRKGLIPYLPGKRDPSPSQQAEPSFPFEVGESVAVKQGVLDPDFGDDMSGWQGRVVEIAEFPPEPPMVTIQWDSLTLRNMPRRSIERAEKEGLDWSEMSLYATELEKATSRDSLEDVAAATWEIASHAGWLHLDEEGERIQQVLDGIDPQDEEACLEAWFKHLEKTLTFPFEAELTEHEYYGPIRAGDTVRVIALNEVFEDYGILVDVMKERKTYQLPLADLKVKDNQAPQYQVVEDYAAWFANR